ncbi:MAG: UDP-N-acetylglucosamine--N-acetylmuramyl-(pentapeptide) pyrophosphoryl-undecaprenol N-acetylglucosamine transferase, partial [Kiritimatiellaeota bacterium]|nr:UDP-N-acetylglucosamine--N-acetylmuramyl-(pentapeptide) pyrophosphoryl-undecaprenol N-acetylglucosamine transferase [Kiritimatiellota bacterium]
EATRDHQARNAEALVGAGAALHVAQRDATPERLADLIKSFHAEPGRLHGMRGRAAGLATPDAGEKLADLVESAMS